MSFKFDDIMKKFYDDPKLGIKTEDAPANASGSAVAGTGDDSSTVVVKKKEKKAYDGRTKEGKTFFKRMAERKAKREASRLAQKVQENTVNREHEYLMVEDNVDMLKSIVKNKQNKSIKFKDGSMKVDLFTASAITQVFDKVNKSNQKKMKDMINGKKAQFMKIADFSLSKVK
ncbi:hypothetical protein MelnitzEXVC044M_30 [Methylophilales phage Melnitz EXVC044M]|nr:hypothetical protein Melnitz1EXVC043M_29 [Methylophilales phage Melnitz-1 EXVC043M]QZI94541.1 hypothetical protein Melnitz2EXVC040M_30 [Methylophilales phage Melnitz-2 EXVC040M]QZI94763.1 hypothetical protein MelnitzEXVC044M_30 [Methylophilales phage Melnitz EXVC044M]QZI94984.1 hypothetical protein Melnitz3EXVC039M_30 [Methylophilales phage Melnitz-3 EXVC039M]